MKRRAPKTLEDLTRAEIRAIIAARAKKALKRRAKRKKHAPYFIVEIRKWRGKKRAVVIRHLGKKKKIVSSNVLKKFKPLIRAQKNNGYLASFTDRAAPLILKRLSRRRFGLYRLRIKGLFGGKNRILQAYVRIDRQEKGFKKRRPMSRPGYISNRLLCAALRKIRSLEGSFSPEKKRNKKYDPVDSTGKLIKLARFLVRGISLDAVE